MRKKSKKNTKSDHKHQYIEAIMTFMQTSIVDSSQVNTRSMRVFICPICGKINDIKILEKDEKGMYYSRSKEKLLEMYPDLLSFDFGEKVYKHAYDTSELGLIDLKPKYLSQIRACLKDPDLMLSDEILLEGLLNSIKPKEMAEAILIENKRIPD